MIIRNATFKNLHGQISKTLRFQPGVNILIGVNGSGKTTILNALAWILSPASIQSGIPAAYLLSTLEFDYIDIAYTVPGERQSRRVKARRSADTVTIEILGVAGSLERPIIHTGDRPRTAATSGIDHDQPADLVARHLDDHRNNAVLRYLSDLPGPLYLPLDRRWPEGGESTYQPARYRRSTSAGQLPIPNVLMLAERAYRQEQIGILRLNDELRTQLLASLFQVPISSRLERVWTAAEMRERQERIVSTLNSLGIRDAERVAHDYFERLASAAEPLAGRMEPDDIAQDPQFEQWVDWILEVSPLANQVERLLPLIQHYELERLAATERTSSFLDSVNNFLSDSGKNLHFAEPDGLVVQLPEGRVASASRLSSGELPLLILFTFLYFRFDPLQEFTMIIDEPELSLHLAWQNRYLQSITEANPQAQFIIATHSPEIAAPFEERTIDISP